MKQVMRFLRPYRAQCLLAPLFKLLEACFELFVPLVVAAIVDVGIAGNDDSYILRMCGVLVLLAVVGLVSAVTAQYFAAVAATGFGAAARRALFGKIQSLSYRELDTVGTSTLITRMTADVNQAQTGVNLTLRLLLRSPFVVFGAWIMAWTVDPPSARIFALVIPALALVVFAVMLITVPMYRRAQNKVDRVVGLTRENLTGVRVLRAFGREAYEREAFDAANTDLARYQGKVGRISALTNPLTYVLINLAIVLLLRVGVIRVTGGSLTQGQVIALYNYMSQILVELVKLANYIVTVTKAVASGSRMAAVLSTESSLKAPAVDPTEPDGAPAITFSGVGMTYASASAPSLSDVTFSVPKGGTLGIIGGTGAGKSTLINLIPRFYDASEGTVLVDGVDVRDYPLETLRAKIGVVPQQARLFRGTVRENLQWGNPHATEEELNAALATAQATDVVASKANGLDELVEAGGKNFSGGQRQRLTVARALVKKPEILILDDSASALDYATDARLRRALRRDCEGMTVVTVSQRVSAVRHADLIVVLADGAVAGIGTDRTLRLTCPTYQEICRTQEKGGTSV